MSLTDGLSKVHFERVSIEVLNKLFEQGGFSDPLLTYSSLLWFMLQMSKSAPSDQSRINLLDPKDVTKLIFLFLA